MARPIKEGLDYLPLDVDFFENPKIEAIADEFECAGECIILRLFCRIYDNGAFVKCNALLTRPIAKRTGTSVETVEAVIERAVEYEIFDKEKFEQFGVLTSKGIQERYLFAKKRSKGVDIPEEFLLVDFDAIFAKNELLQQKPRLKEGYCNINSDSEGVIANSEKEERKERTKEKKEENKSLKVKESKEKESKEKECVTRTHAREEEIPVEDWKHQTLTIDQTVIDLCDEIAAKFNIVDGRVYARQVEALLHEVHRPGVVDGATVIRDGLKALDKAEAVKKGKIKMPVTRFLRPDLFLRLINGEFDEVYTNNKKTTPGIGESIEARSEDYYS